MTHSFPCRGGVIRIALDPTVGTEMQKTRRCVVVSNDRANEFSPQLTVVPLTSYHPRKAEIPVCVDVPAGEGGLIQRSIINCSQIRTVDKARVRGDVLGVLSDATMDKVNTALTIHLALI
ncbi:type II toxin-antitoxin system PemK/MazF family toxin [Candidatus Poribacteria bacterium]|nr:type II toxin-antitoxin system PemK/MazF family toxin [Candidatus Poribacteria bacterium]